MLGALSCKMLIWLAERNAQKCLNYAVVPNFVNKFIPKIGRDVKDQR